MRITVRSMIAVGSAYFWVCRSMYIVQTLGQGRVRCDSDLWVITYLDMVNVSQLTLYHTVL